MRLVRRIARRPSNALRKKASSLRKRMIRPVRQNRHHPAEDLPKQQYGRDVLEKMPESHRKHLRRLNKSKTGRAALRKYKKFWGLPVPTGIETMSGPNVTLVGAGYTTGVYLADKPHRAGSKKWDVRGKRTVAFTPDGRRIVILAPRGNQKNFGKDLKFVGFARETHYVPTPDMEKAGTFKKNTYWKHMHDDEGGTFPRVFKDKAGNHIYAPGTLRIDEWMRR